MDSNDMNQIDLAIAIKTSQIQREELKNITSKHVKDTLMGTVWKMNKPKTVSKAIDDILKISVNEIVAYLSTQAIIQGGMMDENDIDAILTKHSV